MVSLCFLDAILDKRSRCDALNLERKSRGIEAMDRIEEVGTSTRISSGYRRGEKAMLDGFVNAKHDILTDRERM